MKKKALTYAIAILAVILLAGGSFAVYTKTGIAKSAISASNLKVELLFLEADASGAETIVTGDTKITPGDKLSRIVRIKNTGKEDAFVRVKVPNVEMLTLSGGNDAMWTRDGDFYYYNETLKSGETSEALFTEVSMAASVDSNLAGASIPLKIEAQGTQAANNGSTALDAKGWPAA